ncbi:hypothetical protein NCAS_0D04720 [Naumovozyma castellii]|uniref:YCR090C-like protein n=1 Tax=Naumovozyma castellii TaxID=27288 RepID=G0VER2_NAUCA|nr:hypothetical protein NCAS_0D04720 [Naumovozyma castellii CBS 4309]CCC70053.1 hypothetical protein NCAS_0D04720 [Naumovozyma castellii CBS 4309]
MLYLLIGATFSENIKKIFPKDTEQDIAEYAFDLTCTNCREAHGSPVLINSFEKHEMPGSRGEASFLLKCKFCAKDLSINLTRCEDALYNPDNELNEEYFGTLKDKRKKRGLKNIDTQKAAILEFDCRGCEITNFHQDSVTFLAELNSGKIMEFKFEKGENEWFDYDDDENEEVSVTEFYQEIVKGK